MSTPTRLKNTYPIRDVSIFVNVIGHGYPILLMHGGPGLDHTTMLPLQPLANEFTLIFYDHRCNGQSEGAEETSMTWENLTADAEALRQRLGFEQWVVFGHSFGGNVALEYALRYPHRLSRLILMDTGGDQWWVNQNAPELLEKRGFSSSAVQAARRFYNGRLAPNEFLTTFVKFSKAYYYRLNLLTLAREAILGKTPKFRPKALIYGYSQLLNGWTVMDRLGEIQAPTLVMAGRHDFLFPTEHQAALAARIPNARLEIIECAGHIPHMERSMDVIRAVRAFLAEANTTNRIPAETAIAR